MGWFPTSVGSTARNTYDRTREKLWLNGKQPNDRQQQGQLTDELSTEEDLTRDDREVFDQMSSEQMGKWTSDLQHHERLDILGNDEFIHEYWPKTREGIENSEELREKFGLEETEHTRLGQSGRECLQHDEPGAVEDDPYRPEVTETESQSATKDETVDAEISSGRRIKWKRGTKEGEMSKAEIREKWQLTVSVCRKDQDGCKTSLNEFFNEANRRYIQVKTDGSLSERFQTDPNEYVDEEIIEDENVAESAEKSDIGPSQSSVHNETTEEQERTEDDITHTETDSNDSVDEGIGADLDEQEQTENKGQQLLDSYLPGDEHSSETASTSANESTDTEETEEESATTDESTPSTEPNEEETADTAQDEETTDKGGEMLDQYSSNDEYSSEDNSKSGNNSV